MAWPANVADGDIITAAYINSVKNSVATWPGNVDANYMHLDHLKYLDMAVDALGSAQWSAQAVQLITSTTSNADQLKTSIVREVAGTDWATATWIIERLIDGSYSSCSVRLMQNAVELDAGGQRIAQFLSTGIKLLLGGSLKTLSVDGSGFVKAA
jgi:hypothetical protein